MKHEWSSFRLAVLFDFKGQWFILFLMAVVSLARLSANAFGSGAAVGGGTLPREGPYSWSDPDHETCSFGCLYQKANENLGFQIKYAIHKLDALSQLGSMKERSEALGAFCLDGEDPEHCYNRYLKFQIFALRKIHAAIKSNYDSAALVSNQKNKKEFLRPYPQGLVAGSPPERKSQSPYLLTFEDLQDEYKKMRLLGSTGFQQWADKIPFEPSPEDFVKFSEKSRDPENPAGGSFMVLERDENGKLKIDEKAYGAALDKYHKAMNDDLKQMENVREIRGKSVLAKVPSADVKVQAGGLNSNAFEKARVIQVESSIPRDGKPSISGQNRYDFTKKNPSFVGGSPGPSSSAAKASTPGNSGNTTSRKPAETEVKVLTQDDLKKQGVEFLYYSPENWGKVIDDLEAQYWPSDSVTK